MEDQYISPYQRGCREAKKNFSDGKLAVFEKLTEQERMSLHEDKSLQMFILGYLEEYSHLWKELPSVPAPVPFKIVTPEEKQERLRILKERERTIIEKWKYDLDL